MLTFNSSLIKTFDTFINTFRPTSARVTIMNTCGPIFKEFEISYWPIFIPVAGYMCISLYTRIAFFLHC